MQLCLCINKDADEKLLFYFLKRNKIDELHKKAELPHTPTDISVEDAVLHFLYFDQTIFGKADCKLVDTANEIFSGFHMDKGKARTTICYAVLSTIYTEWWQYNPTNDTWVYLSTSHSTAYVGDICIDIDNDGIPDGSPTGGGGSGSHPSDSYEELDSDDYDDLVAAGLNTSEIAEINDIIKMNKIHPDVEPLNDCERTLVLQYPFCALKIAINREQALSQTAAKFSTGFTNGCADAFRHALFNALNTADCGSSTAKKFGDAHECDVPSSEQGAKTMDLANNAVGRLTGAVGNTSLSSLVTRVCDKLNNGDLWILSDPSNSNSSAVTSDGCSCN